MWPVMFPDTARTRTEEMRRDAEARRVAHRIRRERRRPVLVSDRIADALVALRVANPASGGKAVGS
jgi:hypothetical protein